MFRAELKKPKGILKSTSLQPTSPGSCMSSTINNLVDNLDEPLNLEEQQTKQIKQRKALTFGENEILEG